MSFYTIPEDVLRLLDARAYDPNARSSYCILSGGLHWLGEFSRGRSNQAEEALWQDYLPRYLIAIRASLTLGEAQEGQLALWNQVVRGVPNWPGLRVGRCGPEARRQLLAAKRRADACLSKMECDLGNASGHSGFSFVAHESVDLNKKPTKEQDYVEVRFRQVV